jgi:hypothetical protein
MNFEALVASDSVADPGWALLHCYGASPGFRRLAGRLADPER